MTRRLTVTRVLPQRADAWLAANPIDAPANMAAHRRAQRWETVRAVVIVIAFAAGIGVWMAWAGGVWP
jgi:hypothetical protein